MNKTETWLGSKVKIPKCTICNKWLGSDNSLEKKPISIDKGYEIIVGECNHSFHGNCISQDKCPICYNIWKPVDKINIGASEWWIVEEFWRTYFLSKE